MTNDRFDVLARLVAGGGSRRRLLRLLGGGALGAAGTSLVAFAAAPKPNGKDKGKGKGKDDDDRGKAKGKRKGNGKANGGCKDAGGRCRKDGECCSGKCQGEQCAKGCPGRRPRCGDTCCGNGERCRGGRCVADDRAVGAACREEAAPCGADAECCSAHCMDGACAPAVPAPDDAPPADGAAGQPGGEAGDPNGEPEAPVGGEPAPDGEPPASEPAPEQEQEPGSEQGADRAAAEDQVGIAAVSTAPGANQRVLLALYNHRTTIGVDYRRVLYRPRQFAAGLVIDDPTRGNLRVDNPGPYAGWDVLTTFNNSNHRLETRNDWLELRLNRPAVLAVVWRGGANVPSWLGNWTRAADVVVAGRAFPTYRRSVQAGAVDLGAVHNPGSNPSQARDTYWVLFAEADGGTSPEPAVPAGRERPRPNQACPAWVHDQYVATGPDGRSYRTWHHQIDPVYWCYHRHEHGSNPQPFSATQKPLYGYTAGKHPMGMEEVHQGFKTYVLDDRNGNRWMITQHFGTAGLGRACNRFHTVDIAVRRISDGLLLADLHLMADYGRAIVNTTGDPLRPAACPNQAQQALDDGSTGTRKVPVWTDFVGYEPWRFDARGNVLGLSGSFTVNTVDTIAACADARCDQAVQTRNTGSKRFLTPNDGFAIVARANTGTFYTDAHGRRLLPANDPGAVRQYVRPGVNLTLPPGGGSGHFRDLQAWGRPYVLTATEGTPTAREGSIQPPN